MVKIRFFKEILRRKTEKTQILNQDDSTICIFVKVSNWYQKLNTFHKTVKKLMDNTQSVVRMVEKYST